MKAISSAACIAVFAASQPAVAQDASASSQPTTAPAATPFVVEQKQPTATAVLPGNTELVLSMNDELTTRRNREGDTFNMSVVHDVRLGDYVIIPKGSRAVGEVTWLTGKGAFGKSGKMEISVNYVEVSGRRIPLMGEFRQEGEGNTVATVAAVALLWVASPFITGKSGVIPRGRELTVHTKEDLPLQLTGAAPGPQAQPMVVRPVAEPTD